MSCDGSDERLTMDILLSVTQMSLELSFDLSAGLKRLVEMVKGKD